MTSSMDLLDLVYQAVLTGNTDAEARVYKPGDWPSQPDSYPVTKMRLIGEDRQSLGRGGPAQFLTVATIRITSEVSAPATIDDAGATGAEASLWILKRQNETAVINSYPLTLRVQQILSMRSHLAFSSAAATHLAGVQTDIALEFYEGPEDFAPVEDEDLDGIDLELVNHPPYGLSADLQP